MKRKLLSVVLILAIRFAFGAQVNNSDSLSIKTKYSENKTTQTMKSFISIFEIPTTNFSRAVQFYQSILDIKITEIDMQGTQMGLFPSDGQAASGVLIKGEGYQPSADGVVIYLDGGTNLQYILDKIENSGGKIIVPKTLIDEENGYFAMFLDTEGNRLGLHSPN